MNKYSEVLRRYEQEFYVDFAFEDIERDLSELLEEDEINDIKRQATEQQRIDKLFFLLIYKKKYSQNSNQFFNILKKSYDWLEEKLQNSLNLAVNDKLIQDFRRTIKDIPNNRDLNIHRTNFLWEVQRELKNLQRNQYLILHSKVGFGKRWIAYDACCDLSVVRKMGFKIYWLNLSKCNTPETILEKLIRLKIHLQAEDSDIKPPSSNYSSNTKNEIVNVKKYLRKVLESSHKDCLLVLTDVRNRETLVAFDLHCKIMLTTRNVEILNVLSKDNQFLIKIDYGFTEPESLELLAKATKRNVLPPEAKTIHKICKGNPFIMSLIAKNFMEFENEPSSNHNQRYLNWVDILQKYQVREDEIPSIAIEQTLKQLSEDMQECYRMLVIFTDNVNIPIKVLELYWDRSKEDTEAIVIKFQKNSLLETSYVDNEMVCSMHYLYYAYLLKLITKPMITSWHCKLVENYDVKGILSERTELNLLDLREDNYFHYYIGHHLKEANMEELFPMLYLDFGFLEKKLRVSHLPNTIGDLSRFYNEIANTQERRELLTELIDWLPNIEDRLFKSQDSTLLQYGLTSHGVIKKEAIVQAKNYKERIWFLDNDQFRKKKQIIKLDRMPCLVKFLNPNAALIVFIDEHIVLHDLSSDYANEPTVFKPLKNPIKDLQIHKDLFVTLDKSGEMKVYSLMGVPEAFTSMSDRRPSRVTQHNKFKFDVPLGELEFDGKELQLLQADKLDEIRCFFLDLDTQRNPCIIYGTKKGLIKCAYWAAVTPKFELDTNVRSKTGFQNMHSIMFINEKFVLMMNDDGKIQFHNLVTSANINFMLTNSNPWVEYKNPVKLHRSVCPKTEKLIVVCVFQAIVVQITVFGASNVPIVEINDIFQMPAGNAILSSSLSKDAQYLILGTKEGIVVVDRLAKTEIVRRCVGDVIRSVDVVSLGEQNSAEQGHYILISSEEDGGPIVSLHSLKQAHPDMVSRWATDEQGNSLISSDPLESIKSNVWLVGDDLFDVKEDKGELSLLAVGSNNCIHFRKSDTDFKISYESFAFTDQRITKICCSSRGNFIGCENGEIFQFYDRKPEKPIVILSSGITYLECFGQKHMVAGCNDSYVLLNIPGEVFCGKLVKAFHLTTELLLAVKQDCSVDIVDLMKAEIVLQFNFDYEEYGICVEAAYKSGMLAVATSKCKILLFEVKVDSFKKISKISTNNFMITAMALSPDNSLLAVGYANGTIELYDTATLKEVQNLQSHKQAIFSLKFSTQPEFGSPLILVSLSEQICFWNVTHVINNQRLDIFNHSGIRTSQRFSKRFGSQSEDSTNNNKMQQLTLDENPWQRKSGTSEKPELLSCIKFVGKRAEKILTFEKFGKFLTIDNEGNVYYIRVLDDKILNASNGINGAIEIHKDTNGNGIVEYF